MKHNHSKREGQRRAQRPHLKRRVLQQAGGPRAEGQGQGLSSNNRDTDTHRRRQHSRDCQRERVGR